MTVEQQFAKKLQKEKKKIEMLFQTPIELQANIRPQGDHMLNLLFKTLMPPETFTIG